MKRLIIIVGPTAIGKTATAVRMAQQMHTEIISCDSRQFYNEMNIGVARPSPDELEAAKHHFIACRSISNPYNVYDFEHDALALLDSLFVNHDTVIAVGGSGLYIDALCKGINLMPDPSPELRNKLSSRIANGQLDQMISELKRLDPDYYNVVDLKNPIRIQRALEVIYTSGLPYSQLIGMPLPDRPFKIEKIGLRCQRDTLRQRIYSRVEIMMTQGLLQEAESLIPYRHLNTLNTVGYKELFSYFDGKCTLQQAVTDIKNHTWQYAKKQISWFARYNDISWQDIHEN